MRTTKTEINLDKPNIMNIEQQIESALNQPMYEYKFFSIFDKTKTIVTDWCTESNFADAHPGVIVLSQTK